MVTYTIEGPAPETFKKELRREVGYGLWHIFLIFILGTILFIIPYTFLYNGALDDFFFTCVIFVVLFSWYDVRTREHFSMLLGLQALCARWNGALTIEVTQDDILSHPFVRHNDVLKYDVHLATLAWEDNLRLRICRTLHVSGGLWICNVWRYELTSDEPVFGERLRHLDDISASHASGSWSWERSRGPLVPDELLFLAGQLNASELSPPASHPIQKPSPWWYRLLPLLLLWSIVLGLGLAFSYADQKEQEKQSFVEQCQRNVRIPSASSETTFQHQTREHTYDGEHHRLTGTLEVTVAGRDTTHTTFICTSIPRGVMIEYP